MTTPNLLTAPTPATNIQWNAINNAAQGNTLVSQLFAGKTPAAQTPAAESRGPTGREATISPGTRPPLARSR